MYDMKELYEAFSVQEAIELRLVHPEAQIIAGGSDVLVQMREGKRAGKELISIYLIDELRGVSLDENEAIRIGSLTSFSHIIRDPIIQQYIKRQHLQRRNQRRLRLHPTRLGGRHRAHRTERQAAGAHQGLLYKGQHRGYPGGRDPDRHPDPQGELR